MADVVVITGASAGIGRATVREFARHGARIGLLGRGRDGLEGALAEVESAGGKALVLPTDVADPDQVEAAAERIEHELGPIDIWINNAATTVFGPARALSPSEVRRVTEVTYLGTVHGTMSALRRMLPRDSGVIVQVGSALSYRGIPLQSAYSGAKHAMRGFTDALRTELRHDGSGVRVTMVHLAGFNTPQFDWARNHMPHRPRPMAPVFQPEVAAEAIYRAAHHPRREFWVGASTVSLILGSRFVQPLLDRILATKGYSGQQAPEKAPAERMDNLFKPVPGDHGAHGRFNKAARTRSWQAWAALHRGPVVGITLAAVILLLGAIWLI